MSAPNLILTNNIVGNTTFFIANGVSSQAMANVVSNAAASGQAVKLNVITIANPNAVNVPFSVDVLRNGTGNYLAANVTVPGNSTMVVQAKDTAIYLIEGDTLRCNVGAAYVCHFTVSYEVIS
jgi:uncharacterized cupredoxin-like copper-binding protein